MNLNNKFTRKIANFSDYFSVINPKDRTKLFGTMMIQITLGLLDLLGVFLIGILGALSVTGIQSKKPESRINTVIEFLHLSNETFQFQVALIGVAAVFIFIFRTVLSIIFSRKILFFLSRKAAEISSDVISKYLSQNVTQVQARSTQEVLYCITIGIPAITLGVIGTTINIISDISLLLILSIGLFLVNPAMAFGSLFTFSILGAFVYRLLSNQAKTFGVRDTQLSIRSSEMISETLNSFRELTVKGRTGYYANEIGDLRYKLSNTLASISFLPYISKYIIETTVLMAALMISAVQFILNDATQAIATLSIFLAAGMRIAPAALRLQQGAINIRGSVASTRPTLDLITELRSMQELAAIQDQIDLEHKNFDASIEVSNLSFCYPGTSEPVINNVSLTIKQGEVFALVGPSGGGKTTLVDLILGLLEPQSGQIFISSNPPKEAIRKWPGAIAYVPQEVSIFNASILDNVALGFPEKLINLDLVNKSLSIAQLNEFIESLEGGVAAKVGERGSKLSGGQRQRLGIARAMFTNPRLVILDEATSSLDGQIESEVSDAILGLKGKVTVLMIAHRLSTVRNADQVIYMSGGQILARGKFEEVRMQVQDFDRQARLMGL
jgi:ATP-binding cassette, subfamily B, bacterial PglK